MRASSTPLPNRPVTVTVLVFASLAEALGTDRLELDLPDGATAGDVLARVMADPRAGALRGRVRVAIGQRFAGDDDPVGPHDEVALIPPVAGG